MIVMLVSPRNLRMDQRKTANLNTDLTLIEYSKLAHQFILGEKNTLHPYSYHLPHVHTAGFTLLLPVLKFSQEDFIFTFIKWIYFFISICIL
jgi:hypothetical protein